MSKHPLIVTDAAMQLLSDLLFNGGFCTIALAAQDRQIDIPQARAVVGELVGFGYLRRVFLVRAKDSTAYYQITRKAGNLLCRPHPNAARSSPSDSQILRGLARFWFRSAYQIGDGEAVLNDLLAKTHMLAEGLTIPLRYPVGDSYIEAPDALHAYYIFGPEQSVLAGVRQHFLRYADNLGPVKIGFVIDKARAEQLAEQLAEITGQDPSAPDPAAELADISARIVELRATANRGTAMEKIRINGAITQLEQDRQRLAAAARRAEHRPGNGLASVLLPTVIHTIF